MVNVLALIETVIPSAFAASKKHACTESQEKRDGKHERAKVVLGLGLSKAIIFTLWTLSWKGYREIHLFRGELVLSVMVNRIIESSGGITPRMLLRIIEEIFVQVRDRLEFGKAIVMGCSRNFSFLHFELSAQNKYIL